MESIQHTMSFTSQPRKYYILRIGNGHNFKNSSKYSIWGIRKRNRSFLNTVKLGDVLIFVKNKTKTDTNIGKIVAIAEFDQLRNRETGPLISLTATNNDLGWTGDIADNCEVELVYKNLKNVSGCELYTGLKGQSTIVDYDNVKEKISLNIPFEYLMMKKYAIVKNHM